jgi:hypothetical protein
MTPKEMHIFIVTALARGTARAEIASELKARAGADDRYTDLNAVVLQYAEVGPALSPAAMVFFGMVSLALGGSLSWASTPWQKRSWDLG